MIKGNNTFTTTKRISTLLSPNSSYLPVENSYSLFEFLKSPCCIQPTLNNAYLLRMSRSRQRSCRRSPEGCRNVKHWKWRDESRVAKYFRSRTIGIPAAGADRKKSCLAIFRLVLLAAHVGEPVGDGRLSTALFVPWLSGVHPEEAPFRVRCTDNKEVSARFAGSLSPLFLLSDAENFRVVHWPELLRTFHSYLG